MNHAEVNEIKCHNLGIAKVVWKYRTIWTRKCYEGASR